MSAATTSITGTRRTTVERATGKVDWQVNEFDDGRAFMLTAESPGVHFDTHFNAEQWAAFQAMVAGDDSRRTPGFYAPAWERGT